MDLVLYGAPLSPFVRKAEVVLREKGLEFESKPLPVPLPDWFAEMNPARRMPALRDRDVAAEGPEGVIPDSSAICAFLERAVPDPALYPKDPYLCGRALWYEEYADTDLAQAVGLGVFRPVVFPMFAKKDPDLATARKALAESIPKVLDYFEAELAGNDYLLDNTFSIADISLANQVINLELVVGRERLTRWPNLNGLVDRVSSRPSYEANLAVCKSILKQPVDLG
ncbi:MAG: glutathione S-transferase family protein, partial [bacterium]|nr:glutathione S-transferase family protein [bacterium]